MPGPFDYTSQLGSPMQSFMHGVQLVDVMRQREAQMQQQQAQQRRQAELRQAMASLQQDRSPDNVSRVLMSFPELKEQITAGQAVMDDATKAADRNFFGQVLMLRQAGLNDRAEQVMADRLDALKNTPGREAEAQTAQAMFDAYKANPNVADPTISLYLQATDPDFYKTISTQSELTSFQKNLTAAGIDPNSEQGRGMAMQFAQRQADPIVEMQTPSGGRFVGPYSLYVDKYGANGAQPSPVSNVTSKAQYDALPAGATYVAPDGSVRTKGGGSGNATGGFR